ncbi:DUF676 domain-containing protein [[Candida] zeylanoides]
MSHVFWSFGVAQSAKDAGANGEGEGAGPGAGANGPHVEARSVAHGANDSVGHRGDSDDSYTASGLNTIHETSRENSQASSRRTSVLTAERTWYSWGGSGQQPQAAHSPATQPPPSQQQEIVSDEGWTYKRITSAVSYVYTSERPREAIKDDGGGGGGGGGGGESAIDGGASGWLDWLWPFGRPASEEPSLDDDLLRSAKAVVETSRDQVHYAFKRNRNDHAGELAVSGTRTAGQPVTYKYKHAPLTVSQIQENALAEPKPAPQAPQAALQTPAALPVIPKALSAPAASPAAPGSPTLISPPSKPAAGVMAAAASTSAAVASSAVAAVAASGAAATHKGSSGASIKSSASQQPHMVTPTVDSNLRRVTWRTKARLVGEHMLKDRTSECHLYRSSASAVARKAARTKRVVVVGVHGFLPFKMVKTLIGEPTGDSVRFSHEATSAVQRWMRHQGVEDPEIDTISLESKGTIASRVELYRLLLNWVHLIESCDFLFVIGHGQGSVVAIHLLAQLASEGHLRALGQKVGLLSMAGVLQGPFAGLDTKIVIRAYTASENEMLKELFEMQKAASGPAQQLRHSIEVLVAHNVKVTLAGAAHDQFVPLSSALASAVHHPNVFRCLSVGSSTPPFVVALLEVVLMLMNLGHGDHGLLAELSRVCQGGVARGGHTKVYANPDVYYNAVCHALDTTSLHRRRPLAGSADGAGGAAAGGVAGAALGADPAAGGNGTRRAASPETAADYMLPWCVRELLQDLSATRHLDSVRLCRALLAEYRQWQPAQKHWRDLKFCLEGMDQFDVAEMYR